SKCGQNLCEPAPGDVEHAVIVERTPATKVDLGNDDLKPGMFQNSHRRLGCFRMKVVVEGIGPQNNSPYSSPGRFRSSLKPRLKRFLCKRRNSTCRCDSNDAFHDVANNWRTIHEIDQRW